MNDLANICHEAAIKIVGHFETGPYKRRPKHTAELKRAEEAVRTAIMQATAGLHDALCKLIDQSGKHVLVEDLREIVGYSEDDDRPDLDHYFDDPLRGKRGV